ncbi:MAG: benzaldehyde dehydrogenase [Micrococcales bacterium]|nr:MAG: benzaldehyde dehydrogenase [Micrococcales bacterium]
MFTGAWTTGSGADIAVTEKATGTRLGAVGGATVADLDASVASALAAQREWAAKPYLARAEVLHRAAQLLQENPARLSYWLVREAGSGQAKAKVEAKLVGHELREAAATASQPYGELLRSVKPRLSMVRHIPVGVVGVISPFNFPAVLAMRSVAPALALGNAVILKPDPRTSVAGGMALAELLTEAGLPAGLLHVLPAEAEVGQALVAHPDVPCISFTGSTDAGRAIGQQASKLLKKVHLELGGNNALLVLPDADVELAAANGAWGSFLHQGQVCMTTGRHLVHNSLVAQYTELLAAKAERLRVGDPTQDGIALGPIIDAAQRDKVHAVVTESIDSGATLAAGGTFDGLFYRPTVLSGVVAGSRAFSEEVFGPVAPVVGYDSVEEAVEIINSDQYGLSTGILTADAMRAFELSHRIASGMVHINDQTIDDEATVPFGGIKASGSGGHFGGVKASLDAFCHMQWVTMRSDIPPYPF